MSLKDIIDNPLTGLAVVASALLPILAPLAPVWELIASTAGTWFPIFAVSGATILPELGYGEVGSSLLLGAAIIYVAVYVDRLAESLYKRFSED